MRHGDESGSSAGLGVAFGLKSVQWLILTRLSPPSRPTNRLVTRHDLVRWVAVALLVLAAVGCEMQTQKVSSSWDPLIEISDPKTDSRNADPRDPRVVSPRGYAVELTRFSGPDATARAFDLSARLREQAGLADLWTADRGGQSTVYLGRFRDPRSEQATAALKRVRAAVVDGIKPFDEADLVPLSGGDAASLPENDLRNHTGKYALQIGYYDLAAGVNFRKVAEDKVEQLREQGHNAYYYHGPNRSLIAIGPFTYDQAFVRSGQVDIYTAQVLDAQRTFPHNLRNGLAPVEGFTLEEQGIQPSFLVLVR